MTRHQRFEIRIAGFGGQGVVTIGRILGTAFSVHGGKNSVNTQSYGPESRGGACRSEVVVSGGDINYPYVRNADVLIALSQVALDTYIGGPERGRHPRVRPGRRTTHTAIRTVSAYAVPTVALAHETGDSNSRMPWPWGPCMH